MEGVKSLLNQSTRQVVESQRYGQPSLTLDQVKHIQLQNSQRHQPRYRYEGKHYHENNYESG